MFTLSIKTSFVRCVLVAFATIASGTSHAMVVGQINEPYPGEADTIICNSDTTVVHDRHVAVAIADIDDDSIEAILPVGCLLINGHRSCGHAVVRIDDTLSYCDYMDSLETREAITEAFTQEMPRMAMVTNDWYFPPTSNDSSQWHLRNLGSAESSAWLKAADTKVAAAWDITTGSDDVTLTICDTGIPVDYDPSDSSNTLINDDLDDTSRITLDTTFLNDINNFEETNCTTQRQGAHGTISAAVAGAEQDNDYGIAGVDWKCELNIMTALEACDLSEAIRRSSGVSDVFNWSFLLSSYYQEVEDAVATALDSGLLIVAPSGNGGIGGHITYLGKFASWGSDPNHTSGYRNVICVSGTTAMDSIWTGSTRSEIDANLRVTVCAPAHHIRGIADCTFLEEWEEEEFITEQGTSFASPMVAAIATLILAKYPGIGPDSIRTILENTADKVWKNDSLPAWIHRKVENGSDTIDYVDSVWHPYYGHGRINAYKALGGKLDTLESETWQDKVWASEITIMPGDTITIDSGTQVMMSRDDLRARGVDDDLAEIKVEGVLRVLGTATNNIVFQPAAEANTPAWYGIRVRDGGSISIEHATIENARVGLTIEDGGSITKMESVDFTSCATSIQINADTVLELENVTIEHYDTSTSAMIFPPGTELKVTGDFDVSGTVSNKATLYCTNDSTDASWDGVHVLEGGSINFSNVNIPNASTAILVDSGGVIDTPFVNVDISNCLVGLELESGTVKLRGVKMTNVRDYGIDAGSGSPTVRLESTVEIFGIKDTTTGIVMGSGSKLVADGVTVDSGYLGIWIAGDGADTVTNSRFYGNAWCALLFGYGDSADYSSGNVIEKDQAGTIEYGFIVVDQSVVSDGDTINGGYARAVNYASNATSLFSAENMQVIGKVGDDYGLFAVGSGGTNELSLLDCAIDSFFSQSHLYLYDVDVDIEGCRFTSSPDTSNEDVSPYGVWDRYGTEGTVRCSDILHQQTACVQRDYSTCNMIWDGAALGHSASSGWNAIYTEYDGAYYFDNDASDTADARKNWWGGGAPDSSRMSGDILYSNHVADSSDCGPAEYKPGANLPEPDGHLPHQFVLEQNIPNPFNPSTDIRYALPVEQEVSVSIFNVLGQIVRTYELGTQPPGFYSVRWNGLDNSGIRVGTGLYFYRLSTAQFTESKKMLLLR